MTGSSPISVNAPLLDGNEMAYLTECIATGWISSEGPFVDRFERAFARRIGRRHAIAVCNGSAALDVAIAALRLGPGDEVILPTFTIISCVASVIRAGAKPVLVDSDPQTWNMDVPAIASRITSATRAIMAVHIYGLPTDMGPLLALAEQYGLKVIEDAAEMHGQTYRGKACGSFGDISTFSFYPNKLITTGEGGMVTTDDDNLAARCRSLRNLCFMPEQRFFHNELGWNYRMSNLQAALGVAQLERLDEFVQRKRTMGWLYESFLRDIPGLTLPRPATNDAENIYWVYGIVLNESVPLTPTEAMTRLAQQGIGARPFFWPMHEQPVLRRMGLFTDDSHPVAERLARRGFYLPSGLAMSEDQIGRVAYAVKKVLAEA